MDRDLIAALLLCVLVYLFAVIAGAEEPACRYSADKSAVTCGTTGFKKLVDEAISARGDANMCSIRLNTSEAANTDLREALTRCISVVPADPPTRPRWPGRVGYGLTVIGTVLAVSAVPNSPDPIGRATVGLSGVLAMVTGYLLIDRE